MSNDSYQKHLQINYGKKFFFIHMPKCGGTSIDESELFDKNKYPARGHAGYYKFRSHLSEDFKEYKCFTLVRNPWDRLSSAFYYLSEGGAGNPVDLKLKSDYLDVFDNDLKPFLDDFIKQPEKYLSILHMKPMHNFFNPSRCGIKYFIQKLEAIGDTQGLHDFLGVDFVLPHKRKRNSYKKEKVFTKELFEAVRNIYIEDVNLFSYQEYTVEDISS